MDSKALHEALAGNYMLVDFHVRSYGATKTDRAAGDELIASKQAVSDSGKFLKKLLASADKELKAVQSSANNMRLYVYAKTLPWASSSEGTKRGPRLLPTLQAMDFLSELNKRKAAHDGNVMLLKAVWNQRVAEAIQNLGSLANPNDYPSEAEVPSLFSVATDIRPVPAMTDFSRLNVPAELVDALGQRNQQMAEQQYQVAMGDMQKRLVKELERMATQLGKHGAGEKTRLFETLTTNLQGVVDLARSMNMTNNTQLADLADRIEAKLLRHPIDVYKNNVTEAAAVATEAKALAVEAAMESVWS
jgi:hypothetical protein